MTIISRRKPAWGKLSWGSLASLALAPVAALAPGSATRCAAAPVELDCASQNKKIFESKIPTMAGNTEQLLHKLGEEAARRKISPHLFAEGISELLPAMGYGTSSEPTIFARYLAEDQVPRPWQHVPAALGVACELQGFHRPAEQAGPLKILTIFPRVSQCSKDRTELAYWCLISSLVREREIRTADVATLRRKLTLCVGVPLEVARPPKMQGTKGGFAEALHKGLKKDKRFNAQLELAASLDGKLNWIDGWLPVLHVQHLRDVQQVKTLADHGRLNWANRGPIGEVLLQLEELTAIFEEPGQALELLKSHCVEENRKLKVDLNSLTPALIQTLDEFWETRKAEFVAASAAAAGSAVSAPPPAARPRLNNPWVPLGGHSVLQVKLRYKSANSPLQAAMSAWGFPESWSKQLLYKLQTALADGESTAQLFEGSDVPADLVERFLKGVKAARHPEHAAFQSWLRDRLARGEKIRVYKDRIVAVDRTTGTEHLATLTPEGRKAAKSFLKGTAACLRLLGSRRC